MLKLFFADISKVSTDFSALPLSDYRISKLTKAKNEAQFRRNIGAELLLIYAVRQIKPDVFLTFELKTNEAGKPYIPDCDLFFSLSHSGNYVLCAISDASVGADIQKIETGRLKIAERFFTSAENEYIIKSEDKDFAFTKLWSLKESYLKWLGTGLQTPLSSFEIELGNESCVSNSSCKLWHGTIGDYHIAVCTNDLPTSVELIEVKLS